MSTSVVVSSTSDRSLAAKPGKVKRPVCLIDHYHSRSSSADSISVRTALSAATIYADAHALQLAAACDALAMKRRLLSSTANAGAAE